MDYWLEKIYGMVSEFKVSQNENAGWYSREIQYQDMYQLPGLFSGTDHVIDHMTKQTTIWSINLFGLPGCQCVAWSERLGA